jgi:hypothetical protein
METTLTFVAMVLNMQNIHAYVAESVELLIANEMGNEIMRVDLFTLSYKLSHLESIDEFEKDKVEHLREYIDDLPVSKWYITKEAFKRLTTDCSWRESELCYRMAQWIKRDYEYLVNNHMHHLFVKEMFDYGL